MPASLLKIYATNSKRDVVTNSYEAVQLRWLHLCYATNIFKHESEKKGKVSPVLF